MRYPILYNDIGHYLNVVNPNYTVTGFAISTDTSNPYGIAMSQTFAEDSLCQIYTVDEYAQMIQEFMD